MHVHTLEYLFILAWLFVLGSVIGSLLNVCIYRVPREERLWAALKGLWYPPSHCPRCQTRIRTRDNVPILGWLFLRGRCRNCRGKISARYPAIEFLTGALFVLVYWCEIPDWYGAVVKVSGLYHMYGPQGSTAPGSISPFLMLHLRYALHMMLVVALVVATFIDIDLRIIPDAVTLPAMVAAILANWLIGQVYIVPAWYQTPEMLAAFPSDARFLLGNLSPPPDLPAWVQTWLTWAGVPGWFVAHPHWHGLVLSALGILVGGGVVWAVRLIGHFVLGREAMGFGDVVLLAMIGSFLGWQATLVVFFLAPVCALVCVAAAALVWRGREIPYGPYLSLATLLLLLFWRPIWPWLEVRVFALGPLLPVAAIIMFVALGALLYITRRVQTLLGISHDDDAAWVAEWTSADQLLYQAGERTDDRQGQWVGTRWRGELTGRGIAQNDEWRCRAAIMHRLPRLPDGRGRR